MGEMVPSRAPAKRIDLPLALAVITILAMVGGVFAYSLLWGAGGDEPSTTVEAAPETTLPQTSVLSQRLERPPDGSWVTVLERVAFSEVGQSAEEARLTVETDTGLTASVLRSDEYATLEPGDWVVFHDAGCADESCAAQVCDSIGWTRSDGCHAQLLRFAPG